LAQICTKSFVGCGFASDAPTDSLAGLEGGNPSGKEKEVKEGRKEEEGTYAE